MQENYKLRIDVGARRRKMIIESKKDNFEVNIKSLKNEKILKEKICGTKWNLGRSLKRKTTLN